MGALCSSTTNAAVAPGAVPKVDISGADLVQLSTNLVALKQDVEDLTKQTQVALLQDATEKMKEATAAVTAAAVLSPTGTALTDVPVTVVTDVSNVTVTVPVVDLSGTLLNLLASNVPRDIQQYR